MADNQNDPLLPYAGTSGWSGSDTSRERVEIEDSDGTTSKRQKAVLTALHTYGSHGLTVQEVREETGWHHGQASSALSVLHKEGRIARLRERRNHSAVYVLPEYVNGRETAPHGRKAKDCPTCEGMALMYETADAEVKHLKALLDTHGIEYT